MDQTFAIGHHRPVYFWAGPTTIRMNRLKFMNAPVNEATHLEAHTSAAAQKLVEAGFNWAYLMFNWGFPPEQDQEQWDSFRQAVQVFHTAGLRVFGYVQLSNCVYQGTHEDQDWYAQDQWGRPIHYYTGRYMTCWLSPDWRDQLLQRVGQVVDADSDGVFLDNPWMGLHTLSLFDTWLSGAGCHCPRCQDAFSKTSGEQPIPTRLDPHDPHTQRYLNWRAQVMWQFIDELARHARSLRPDVVVAENVYDAINCNHYADFGVDLREAARISDVVMIEDHSLPYLAEDGTPVVNSITSKAARAWSGSTPVTTDPYIAGIGFDPVYTPLQFQRAVVEGAACGTTTIVKGTEFFDERDGGFTLITGAPFSAERAALGRIHRWLEEHADLYQNRREASPLAVYFPYDTLPFDWRYSAPLTFGACQTLLAAGLPYRIVGPGDWAGIEVLLVPPGGGSELEQRINSFQASGGRVIALGEGRSGATLTWDTPRPELSFLQRHPTLRTLVGRPVMALYRAYFESRSLRNLLDRTNITRRILQGGPGYNPLFKLPPQPERDALLKEIGDLNIPRLSFAKPVAIEWWLQGEKEQIHLVNYDDVPQQVTLTLPTQAQARVMSPAGNDLTLTGTEIKIPLTVYSVAIIDRSAS